MTKAERKIYRKKYYAEDALYTLIASDVRNTSWLTEIKEETAFVIMEGISMYLKQEELLQLLNGLCQGFSKVAVLMDCYTKFAAKASKYKNPINDVGVTQVYGLDDPSVLPGYLCRHEMTPSDLVDQLQGMERKIFRTLYAGKTADKMYRLYEYEGGSR